MRALTKWRAYLPQILGVAAIAVGIGVLVGGLLLLADAQSDRANSRGCRTDEQGIAFGSPTGPLRGRDRPRHRQRDGRPMPWQTSRMESSAAQQPADTSAPSNRGWPIWNRRSPRPSRSQPGPTPWSEALADQRDSQVEALLADEYTTLTALRLESVELTQELIGNAEALSTQMEDLPTIPMNDPYTYSGRTIDARMPADPVPLDPPTGPAVMTVELPELIGCVPWGSDGCKYRWTATFAESNWLDVAINQVSVRYRSPSRSSYCYFTPDWVDVEIDVPAGGSDTWSRSFLGRPRLEVSPRVGRQPVAAVERGRRRGPQPVRRPGRPFGEPRIGPPTGSSPPETTLRGASSLTGPGKEAADRPGGLGRRGCADYPPVPPATFPCFQ